MLLKLDPSIMQRLISIYLTKQDCLSDQAQRPQFPSIS